MKFNKKELPKWFVDKLPKNANTNDIIEILLNDYIKNNKPKHVDLTDREYVERYITRIDDGRLLFYNHDTYMLEEPTIGRLIELIKIEREYKCRK